MNYENCLIFYEMKFVQFSLVIQATQTPNFFGNVLKKIEILVVAVKMKHFNSFSSYVAIRQQFFVCYEPFTSCLILQRASATLKVSRARFQIFSSTSTWLR